MDEWLRGDPAHLAPLPERNGDRNQEWGYLNTSDILSMPDTWEYPWFAAWDMAFHCIPLALLDALDPPVARTVLVGGLVERATYGNKRYALSAHEYVGGYVDQHGYCNLETFALGLIVRCRSGSTRWMARCLRSA